MVLTLEPVEGEEGRWEGGKVGGRERGKKKREDEGDGVSECGR